MSQDDPGAQARSGERQDLAGVEQVARVVPRLEGLQAGVEVGGQAFLGRVHKLSLARAIPIRAEQMHAQH